MSDELARTGEILAERDRVRAILAPNGKDLEKLLIRVHTQSVQAQRKARKSLARIREELNRRLDEGQTLEIHGNEVIVSTVTNRDLIGLGMLENDGIKVEAMAQRSYDVHRMTTGNANPQAGSIESFIDQLEQEEQTENPGDDIPPDW
jgi:uncharacterized protein with von Willebrand factor type A (vWA) domain